MTLSTIDVPVDLARSLERYRREHDTLSKILYPGDARCLASTECGPTELKS